MSENNKHEAANDVAVLRPDCHAKITGVRLYRDKLELYDSRSDRQIDARQTNGCTSC